MDPILKDAYDRLALFAEWSAEFDRQNAALVASGEEPLTVAEVVSLRVEDCSYERGRQEAVRVDRWWNTYNASLMGLRATSINGQEGLDWSPDGVRQQAIADADAAHGPLTPEQP